MKLIINKALDNINDSVNIKIIEITSADFLNNDLDYFVYKYQIPLIKFTDTEEIFNIKNFKSELSSSLSETEIILDENDLELISSGSGGGSQDLQSVLDNGQYANAQIDLLDGNSLISTTASGNSVQIGNGSVGGYNILNSTNIFIDFTNRTAAGDMMLTFDPNKPNGNYTLATLDDINLQKALSQSGEVNNEEYYILFKDALDDYEENFSKLDRSGFSTQHLQESGIRDQISIDGYQIYFEKYEASVDGGESISSVFLRQNESSTGNNTIINLPIINSGEEKTLATLDDILNINLDSRVYANNAAAITGGLVVKDLYRTATGELRVVV